MDENSALPESVEFGSGEGEELFPCHFQYCSMKGMYRTQRATWPPQLSLTAKTNERTQFSFILMVTEITARIMCVEAFCVFYIYLFQGEV